MNALASRFDSARRSPIVILTPLLSTATRCAGWRSTWFMRWTTVPVTPAVRAATSGPRSRHGGKGDPAVDHDRLPVDRCTLRRAQERHDLGDLGGRGEAAGGRQRKPVLLVPVPLLTGVDPEGVGVDGA